MIIGGLTGNPTSNRLNYILPIVRVDHKSGLSLESGYMLVQPMKGLVPDRPNRATLNAGVSNGGEETIPTTEPGDFEGVALGSQQESSG